MVAAAKAADVVIFIGGLNSILENEEQAAAYDGFFDGDRTPIELPSVQEDLLQALYATGKPVVLVNCSGSAMASASGGGAPGGHPAGLVSGRRRRRRRGRGVVWRGKSGGPIAGHLLRRHRQPAGV